MHLYGVGGSSTTGQASSSGRAWWRGTARWSASARPTVIRLFRSRNAVSDHEFDVLVRQVYKVLLTRGMRGTILYATDHETRRLLGELVEGGKAEIRFDENRGEAKERRSGLRARGSHSLAREPYRGVPRLPKRPAACAGLICSTRSQPLSLNPSAHRGSGSCRRRGAAWSRCRSGPRTRCSQARPQWASRRPAFRRRRLTRRRFPFHRPSRSGP